MNGRDQNISPNRFESHEHPKEVMTAPPSHQQTVITRERRLRCCVLRSRIRQGLKGGWRFVPDPTVYPSASRRVTIVDLNWPAAAKPMLG